MNANPISIWMKTNRKILTTSPQLKLHHFYPDLNIWLKYSVIYLKKDRHCVDLIVVLKRP